MLSKPVVLPEVQHTVGPLACVGFPRRSASGIICQIPGPVWNLNNGKLTLRFFPDDAYSLVAEVVRQKISPSGQALQSL